MVVGLRSDKTGIFIMEQSASAPGGTDIVSRGIESTISLANARRFADGTALANYLSAMSAPAGSFVAMTLP